MVYVFCLMCKRIMKREGGRGEGGGGWGKGEEGGGEDIASNYIAFYFWVTKL